MTYKEIRALYHYYDIIIIIILIILFIKLIQLLHVLGSKNACCCFPVKSLPWVVPHLAWKHLFHSYKEVFKSWLRGWSFVTNTGTTCPLPEIRSTEAKDHVSDCLRKSLNMHSCFWQRFKTETWLTFTKCRRLKTHL